MKNNESIWYNDSSYVRQKENKVVVKLKNQDGTFKESCIVPTVMYPLNGPLQVFNTNNTCLVEDKTLLEVFNSVKYQVGKCYQNSIDLAAALRALGYEAKTYVGWLFLSETTYPVHHSWVVVENHVLDLSDDYSIMLYGDNKKNFDNCKSLEEQRQMLASFRQAAAKQPNSVRCSPVGCPSSFLLYIGCECDPDKGRKIYRDLIKTYPNHPVHKNVGADGLNATQSLFKKEGLMQ